MNTIVCFDIETKAKDDYLRKSHWGCDIDILCYSYLNDSNYYTVQGKDIEKVIKNWDKVIVHNAIFDCGILKRLYNKKFNRIYDTMLLSWWLNPNIYSIPSNKSLDFICKTTINETKKGTWNTDNKNDLIKYCQYDVYLTKKLFLYLLKNLHKKYLKRYKIVHENLIYPIIDMEIDGIKINRNGFKDLEKIYSAKINSILPLIYNLIGDFQVGKGEKLITNNPSIYEKLKSIGWRNINTKKPVLNLKSNDDMAYILKKRGVNLKNKTETGKYKMNKHELKKFNNPLVHYILQFKYYDKQGKDFIKKGLEISKYDDCIHTNFNITGTSTGRMSSSGGFNVQNIPKTTDHGLLRSKFIPHKKENVFIVSDIQQGEVRMLAELAQDNILASVLNSNKDFHEENAKQLMGYYDPSKRTLIKNLSFALIYGGSAELIANISNANISEVKIFIDKFKQTYKKVTLWIEWIKIYAINHKLVSTISGKYRTINTNQLGWQRKAVNTVVQGSLCDIINQAIIDIYNNIPNIMLRLQVHDEIVIECDKTIANEMKQQIKFYIENSIYKFIKNPIVKIKTDTEIRTSWGIIKNNT